MPRELPRALGIRPWKTRTGPLNLITDVPGVRVGHTTLSHGRVRTGVTAILPHPGNLFRDKPRACAHVINGFGKSMGLIQVREMGTLETPIILTNTLSIGTAANALIAHALEANPEIGRSTGTVNPLVFECNDGHLNDIRGMHVTRAHVCQAIASAGPWFEQGAVGAGTGMCAFGLKGGIRSASRVICLGQADYTLRVLVLINMGKMPDLVIAGSRIGPAIAEKALHVPSAMPDGSVIVILATDIPLSCRQLGRISRRAQNGLALTGSRTDSGSGEIALAFSTAHCIPHFSDTPLIRADQLHEDRINPVLRVVPGAVEEAVLNAMFMARTIVGRDNHRADGLADHLDPRWIHRIKRLNALNQRFSKHED